MSLMHSAAKIVTDDFLMSNVDAGIRGILLAKLMMNTLSEADFPRATMLGVSFVTNYLQLKTIYGQRRTHKLQDWRVFCDALESSRFPFFNDLVIGGIQ
jgi:hypothetical protein